jgi:O-antigen ligase
MEAITAVREIALVSLALFMALFILTGDRSRFRFTPLAIPLALYLAVAVASLFTAVDLRYSLRELRAEVLKGMLLFYAAAQFVRTGEHLEQVWRAILAGAAIMSLAGVVLFFTAGGHPLDPFMRAGSLHSGYGAFCTYLVTVWPYLLLAVYARAGQTLRPLLASLALVGAVAAYLTFSRGAWLAMVLQLGLCVLVVARHRVRNVLLGVTACCLILAGLLLAPGASHGERWARLMHDPQDVGGTAGDLLALWRHSLNQFKEKPFTGIGLGRQSFSKAYQDFRRQHQPLLWHAHNMFLDQALQLGLQGLAVMVLVMAMLVALLWPRSPPSPSDLTSLFGAATAIMVIGFAVRNLFDDFFADDSGLLFWMLAGLALGARQMRRERPAPLV